MLHLPEFLNDELRLQQSPLQHKLSSAIIIVFYTFAYIQGAVATAGQVMEWLKNEMKFVSSIDEIGKYSNVFVEHFSVGKE